MLPARWVWQVAVTSTAAGGAPRRGGETVQVIGPLAGAGAAALFGLAGAAGVAGLAFLGLKEQAAAGVGQGQHVQEEFGGITKQLGVLGRIAADAVGPGLNAALDQVRRSLPGFAGTVNTVGLNLGNAARRVSFGITTVFSRAQPLIVQFAGYIDKAALAFEKFSLSKTFGTFLNYAGQELPKVIDAVSSLGKGLVSAAVSMKTLGDNTLATLGGIGKVIGAAGKLASFKFGASDNSTASQLGFTSIGGLLGNLSNPIGATLNAYSVSKNKQSDANSQIQAAAQARIAAAQQSYSSQSTGTAATLGATNGAYQAATNAAKATADQLAQTTLQMQLQNDAAGLLTAALDALSGKNLGVATTLNSFQTGLLGLSDTFKQGAFSSTAFTASAVAERGALQQAVVAAQAHAEAVGKQTGHTQDATRALAADYAQIVANTGATGAQKQAILAYIQSIGKIPPVKPTQLDITGNADARLANIRSQLDALHSKELSVNYTVRLNYDNQAANILNRTGAFSADGNIFSSVGHYAMGGIVDKLKASVPSFSRGAENHVPQIAMPNGGFRVWAEPETQGEAYIPFAMDRRERATDILSDVAQRFGYGLIPAVSPAAVAAASSGGVGGPVEIAGTVAIDLPGVGRLNGHMTGLANGAISRRESDTALMTSAGSSSRLT